MKSTESDMCFFVGADTDAVRCAMQNTVLLRQYDCVCCAIAVAIADGVKHQSHYQQASSSLHHGLAAVSV